MHNHSRCTKGHEREPAIAYQPEVGDADDRRDVNNRSGSQSSKLRFSRDLSVGFGLSLKSPHGLPLRIGWSSIELAC